MDTGKRAWRGIWWSGAIEFHPPLEGGSKFARQISGRGHAAKSQHQQPPRLQTRFAKDLCTTATNAERILWSLLRTRHLGGLRFRRQQPIGPYIVDFFCPSAKLIVELDGSQHGTGQAVSYDDDRARFLQSRGYRVLRFWNTDLTKDRSSVLAAIHRTATQPSP